MKNLLKIAAIAVVTLPSLAGCDTELEVDGSVRVSGDLARMFSQDQPGQVVGQLQIASGGGSGIWSLGYVCGAGTDGGPVEIPFRINKIGCGTEGKMTVWIEPYQVPAGSVVKPPCGAEVEFYRKNAPAAPPRSTSAPVFAGRHHCSDSATDHVSLILE